MYDVGIVGGGASGLLCAILCAKAGLRTIVVEKNERVGKKILATGNGRCNLSGSKVGVEGFNTGFVAPILGKYNMVKTIALFEQLGLLTRYEDSLVYPYSNQANTVLSIFLQAAQKYGVEIKGNCFVDSFARLENGYTIDGKIKARCVVFACGSPAGGGEDNKKFFGNLGIDFKKFTPSLTHLITDTINIKGLSGIKVKARASLEIEGEVVDSECGEVLFKDNGLSGIAAFNLSAQLARRGDGEATAIIDLMPEKKQTEVTEILLRLKHSHDNWFETLQGILPKAVAVQLLKYARIDDNAKAFLQDANSSAGKISAAVKRFAIAVKGVGRMENAQAASGGIQLHEIDKDTLELKKFPDCFVTGELADVDGKCGGYNLQWAWSSAQAVAGTLGDRYAK